MDVTDTDSTLAPLVQEVIAQARIPRATYRFQFNTSFTFRDAQALVEYLDVLGVSDMYASPLLQPRKDSEHGYDVSDPTRLNPALGSQEDFDSMVAALRQRNMGLLLDTVPNHMGIGDETNVWWMDVLENGPSSVYAKFFDISWQTVKPELTNKVLLPVLEDQYGQVLESGKLRLVYETTDAIDSDNKTFWIMYHSMRLPLAPGTYSQILEYPLEKLVEALGAEDTDLLEYQSILTALNYLPNRTETDPLRVAERNREKEIIKRRLTALYDSSTTIRAAIDSTVTTFNGTVGDPKSFDMLDQLINAQAYRLAFWRVAAEEINYRRFFDINDLAAIRPEDPEVFAATHDLILRLLAEGKATGLRIDHIDGLYDPDGYLWQLQEQYVLRLVKAQLPPGEDEHVDDGELAQQISEQLHQWHAAELRRDPACSPQWPLYVVAEKILGEGETLPLAWAAYGTTGYDFLNDLNGLFIDRQNARAFDAIYSGFIERALSFNEMVNSTKKMIMLVSMTSEIYNLSHQLERMSERNRRYRDFTLDTITFALREVIAALPVYRTYITDAETVTTRDRRFIEVAVAKAQRRNPRTANALFQFIRDTLLLRNLDRFDEEGQQELIAWVRKFQQVSGPVMAKGVEDTAFYRYNRLVSLNEVGGHPDQFGSTPAAFHDRNRANQRSWPNTMLATSTHDTKRSEDVRARIDVLSEMPDAWREALDQWCELNAPHRTETEDETAPDLNDEYLLYQTLIGAWPFNPHAGAEGASRLLSPAEEAWGEFRERIIAYMQKATKEAKEHTSWINADEQYDAALNNFIRGVMNSEESNPFLQSIMHLADTVAFFGQFNSLAQQLLKLTSPGVPDLYQGTEMWDLSLVDPDNRRPVDYALRQHLLGEMLHHVAQAEQPDGTPLRALTDELLRTLHDGRIKLYMTQRALEFRRQHPDLFAMGDYHALEVQGEQAAHAIAFARSYEIESMLVVVPRLVVGLTGGAERAPLGDVWGDTWLPLPEDLAERRYRNWFTGETLVVETVDGMPGLRLSAVLAIFPVSLLTRVGNG
ncbi:MAG TPA: malto-oligosyltrehalose synthase [Roseiflexaceae bacterium]|nr:malto-oligosyltrehalose synthase [Roseiflexaceae bacterium]